MEHADTSDVCWAEAWAHLPLLTGLSEMEAQRLRELATLFLHEKSLESVQGLELTKRMEQMIALQACLPVLHLDFDWLDGWVSVVVYPGAFVSNIRERDFSGVVHTYREARSGESWDRGPLVVAWSDVETDAPLDGNNVIIHEIAHKLDALDGVANGKPPLHSGMNIKVWSDSFSAAYDDFVWRVESYERTAIDPYAAHSPAEFLAVFSEAFFETPQEVKRAYPDVFGQLCRFYRQDPLTRLGD